MGGTDPILACGRCQLCDASNRDDRLCGLQGMYGQAMANADQSSPPLTEPGARSSAMDVVQNPHLSLDEKRSILMNRAFDEYEHGGRASGAEGTRWSRLKEIDEALLELERDPEAGS